MKKAEWVQIRNSDWRWGSSNVEGQGPGAFSAWTGNLPWASRGIGEEFTSILRDMLPCEGSLHHKERCLWGERRGERSHSRKQDESHFAQQAKGNSKAGLKPIFLPSIYTSHILNLLWGSRKAPLPPSFSFLKYLRHFNIYCIYSALNFTYIMIGFFLTMCIFSPQICYACILNKQSVWSQVKGNWCLEKLFPFLLIIKSSYFDFTCIAHHCFLTKLIFLLWSDSSTEELPLKGQCVQ